MKDRITIRFNDEEQAEINLLMSSFQIENPSEAVKMAVAWVNHHIKFVTESQIPPNYKMVLMRKRKTDNSKRKVF